MDEIVYYDGLGENVIVNGPCCSHLSARPCASGKELRLSTGYRNCGHSTDGRNDNGNCEQA